MNRNRVFSNCLLIVLFFAVFSTFGQQPVEYKHLGISFEIPEGWIGREVEGGYLIGSNTESGFALISTHQYKSVDQIRQLALQGFQESNGTSLTLHGNLNAVLTSGISGEFEGTLEGEPAKTFIVALVNPHGDGVTIMAASTPELFSDMHKKLALELAGSVNFSKPEVSSVVVEWRENLKNSLLTYMNSYSSSGSGYDGYSTGGGYSDEVKIHLCGEGYFKYSSNSSISIDTGGAFGNSSDNNRGNGTWEVVADGQGGAVLRLNFHNGEIYEYNLQYRDKKTLLNGKRYFKTYGNAGPEYAPDCF